MSEKILLTFLGAGNYQPVDYQIQGIVYPNETLFSVALARHLKPDRVISVQTAFAAEKHGHTLSKAIQDQGIAHDIVPIPDGKNEEELWQIFQLLAENVPPSCTLHLDITHGFRTQPLIAFIALTYLRTTRKITIGGVHYGAFEAKNENNVAPEFDLTPFLTLLDWNSAAEQFLNTGNASRIGVLLKQIHSNEWQKKDEHTHQNILPRSLANLGASIEMAAADLSLLRTKNFALSSAQLKKSLKQEQLSQELGSLAKPFLELLTPVEKELTQFSDTDLRTHEKINVAYRLI